MPRTAKVTAEEILKAEEASDSRRRSRADGFELMKNRDSSAVKLSNGVGMLWHVPRPEFPDTGVWVHPAGCRIPDGYFALEVDGKEILFDTEEFRRYLRWA